MICQATHFFQGYIVINLACGYLYGLLHGIAVTVITATIGVVIAHILCKVDKYKISLEC